MTSRDYDDDGERANAHIMKNRLDTVTRLLCEVMTSIDKGGVVPISDDLHNWWRLHKEADRAEKARLEAIKRAREKQLRKEILERQMELASLNPEAGK